MTPAPKFRRGGAELWISTAYAVLAEEGHEGLTIDKLTARTGKTRGSFYHHFGSHDGFVARLLDDWRDQNTERIARMIAADPEPRERRARLHREAVRLNATVETAIRRWAGADHNVAKACWEVDRRRMEVLARDLVALAKSKGVRLSAREAETLALIDYATFVGAQMLAPGGRLEALPDTGRVSEEMLDAFLERRHQQFRSRRV
jgi:AcrR family transcriptional regulator